jgi:hypothetical protein
MIGQKKEIIENRPLIERLKYMKGRIIVDFCLSIFQLYIDLAEKYLEKGMVPLK